MKRFAWIGLGMFLLFVGCSSLQRQNQPITPVLPPFPEDGFTMARIPTDKYRPGSIVYLDKGKVVKVDELQPPAGAFRSDFLSPGQVTGHSTNGLTLGLALSLVGLPVSANIGADYKRGTQYTFEWKDAALDTVLIADPAYESSIVKWMDRAASSPNPMLKQSFYLIQEAAKVKSIKMTMRANWTEEFKASVSAVVSDAVKLSPSVGIPKTSNQNLVITNQLPSPVYVSYTLLPLKVARGLGGQSTLVTEGKRVLYDLPEVEEKLLKQIDP